MLRAVLLDWDGTLIDAKDAIVASYRTATRDVLGTPFPSTEEEWNRVSAMRAQESFGGMVDDPKIVERLIAAYHDAYLDCSRELARPYPGVRQTLATIAEIGFRTGVVTSKGRDRVDADAERFGLASFVEAYVTGDASAERKPHPGPIIEGLDRMGLCPDEVMYVGDGPHDVVAGHGAGVKTVAAVYGMHPEDECLAEHPDHVIRDITELVPLLREQRD